MPDVDLMIRTSGEQRLSNYLLWQMAYAEMMFVDTPWPAFDREELWGCLEEFAGAIAVSAVRSTVSRSPRRCP